MLDTPTPLLPSHLETLALPSSPEHIHPKHTACVDKILRWNPDLVQEIPSKTAGHRRPVKHNSKPTPIVYYINSTQHTLNISCKATMYTPDSIATSCCPDTDTSINLIDQALLSLHWPNLAVQTAATPVNLSGIERGPVATEFVSLPFAFQATDYTLIPFVAEMYIVDSLPVGLLLSGGFLKTNSLDFIWRKGPETIDHIH